MIFLNVFFKCNIWLDFYVSSIKNGFSANKTVQIQCIWINQRTLPSSIEWIWLNEICFKKHGKIFALVRWKDFYNKIIQQFNLFSTIHNDLFIEKNKKDSCFSKILFKSTHNFTIVQRITFLNKLTTNSMDTHYSKNIYNKINNLDDEQCWMSQN